MNPIHGYQCSVCGKMFEVVRQKAEKSAFAAEICCDPKKVGPLQVGEYVDAIGDKWKVVFVGRDCVYASKAGPNGLWTDPCRIEINHARAFFSNVEPVAQEPKELEDLVESLDFFVPDPVAPEG